MVDYLQNTVFKAIKVANFNQKWHSWLILVVFKCSEYQRSLNLKIKMMFSLKRHFLWGVLNIMNFKWMILPTTLQHAIFSHLNAFQLIMEVLKVTKFENCFQVFQKDTFFGLAFIFLCGFHQCFIDVMFCDFVF